MTSNALYNNAFIAFFTMAFVVFFLLLFGNFKAPYGKHTSNQWGKLSIPDKWGWLIMESPSSIIFAIYFFMAENMTKGLIALFIIWQFHYFYRSFIYPFQPIHSKRMPIALMLSALSFQLINTCFQANWVFNYAPQDMYNDQYITSWNFIVGVIVFLIGTFINRYSDKILRALRKPGETDYKIPYGGLYKWVSCPNYLGEMIIWLGWAIMLWSPVGVAFFIWTVANLLPRALASHKWYHQKFPDTYPKNRKALIPFIL